MSRRRWLVAYDISSPSRLRLVHKIVSSHGYSLQYSVFLCDLSRREFIGLKADLHEVVHHRDDSLVFIDLGQAGGDGPQVDYLGRAPNWPDTGRSVIV